MPMETATPPAVANAERAALAEVFDRFAAGTLGIERFAWQVARFVGARERGTAAVAQTWYDCGEVDFLAWWRTVRSLSPPQQALLQRCRLFLRSDLPYQWPEPPNLLPAELGQALLAVLVVAVFGHLVFGVAMVFLGLWFAGISLSITCIGAGTGVVIGYRALREWQAGEREGFAAVGDLDVWPFLHRADHERALAGDR
jgi:hypothetical protein